jgi:hypothetical protein
MFRRLIRGILNRKKWPDTKKNYQSDIDLFLQNFNKNRTCLDPSRQKEKENAARIAEKRDKVTQGGTSCPFENF